MYKLLHKDTKWSWSDECEKAVSKLKEALTSDTLLVHYDPNKPLLLATDASPVGVDCVIPHIMEDGSKRPIAYAWRSLTSSERNHPQIEREALCLGPIGDFCIGDGEKNNCTRDASRCLAILSINTSRLFAEGSVIPPEHRLMLVNFHRECIGDAKKSPVGPSHKESFME